MRRTKIITTIGPASESDEIICRLLKAGVNAFRLNFSHSTLQNHKKVFSLIRKIADTGGYHIPVIQDLQGPKIRIGKLKTSTINLEKDKEIKITTKNISGDEKIISTTYKHFIKDINIGTKILLDDGMLELEVLRILQDKANCKVVRGGVLKEHKGINLPGIKITSPSLTDKDVEDLKFGLKLGVDFVAISFVRNRNDIVQVKEIIKKFSNKYVPVIAKIERSEAITHFDEILEESDGIMIARGDLGIEILPEKVPVIQKKIINKVNEKNKFVITATQMLESMISSPIPTRAEASDVANAVLDGTDSVMLSGETAVGKYPVESVEMMVKIIRESEEQIINQSLNKFPKISKSVSDFTAAIAHSVFYCAKDIGAKAIVAFSQSGQTLLMISKYKPDCKVIGVTINPETARRMNLFSGVQSCLIDRICDTETLFKEVEKKLLLQKLVKKGDVIIITSGIPPEKSGTTNLLKIHKIVS